MANKLRSIGISAPPGFDASSYEAINDNMDIYKSRFPAAWGSFAAAWKGLAYRYRAATNYSSIFSGLVTTHNAPPPEQRYQQDHALFVFSVCALSTVECFHFGAYCFASVLDPEKFPVNDVDLKKIFPECVRDKYKTRYSNERLSAEMKICLCAKEYRQLKDLRNVLAHRGMPGRSFHVGGKKERKVFISVTPKDLSSQFSFEIDEHTSESLRKWLARTTAKLVKSARTFCDTQM